MNLLVLLKEDLGLLTRVGRRAGVGGAEGTREIAASKGKQSRERRSSLSASRIIGVTFGLLWNTRENSLGR